MGIAGSKLVQKAPENAVSGEKGGIPSTPILTPKIFRESIEKENLDPRSPSKHIARTPLELLSAAADKLSTLKIDTEGDPNKVAVETPLKRHLILGVDPRSPSLEVQRTPIVVSASPDKKLPPQIRNKHLDKARNSVVIGSPKAVPPKLLESNPATPKLETNTTYKRKSFVLLETNIDFTETDLDTVIKGKSLQNLYVLENIPYCEVVDPRSPTTEFFRTPMQVCDPSPLLDTSQCLEVVADKLEFSVTNSTNESTNNVIVNEYNIDDYRESTDSILPKTGAIMVTNEEENNGNKSETDDTKDDSLVSANEALIEENSDDNDLLPESKVAQTLNLLPKSAPVSPPSNPINLTPKKTKSQPITPPIIDLTADVRELDKKLTNLIYEDNDDLVVCPRPVQVKDPISRTPLGLRNGTDNRRSAAQQKLKVRDKPRKVDYAVSRIPVFKQKKIKAQQCENTPPRGMRGAQSKKSQWDPKDDTLVI